MSDKKMIIRINRPGPAPAQIVKMLRGIYGELPTTRGERFSISRELCRLARLAGVTVDYQDKARTFEQVVAAAKVSPGNVESFGRDVREVWNRYGGAKAKAKAEAEPGRLDLDADDPQRPVLDALEKLYRGGTVEERIASRQLRRKISGYINRACHRYGVSDPTRTWPGLFILALRAGRKARGEEPPFAKHVRTELEDEGVEIGQTGEARGAGSARGRRPMWPDGSATYEINIVVGLTGCVGFVRGEEVRAEVAADLAAGEIGAAWGVGHARAVVGRVVCSTARHITIRDDQREHTFKRAELEWLGRVNPEPVGRWDGPSEAERARIKKLRGQLDALGREDDQIIRCSERYRLKKEIFDIEHPAGGDPDDWSAWQE